MEKEDSGIVLMFRKIGMDCGVECVPQENRGYKTWKG